MEEGREEEGGEGKQRRMEGGREEGGGKEGGRREGEVEYLLLDSVARHAVGMQITCTTTSSPFPITHSGVSSSC